MKLRSLAQRTDLIFRRAQGRVTDCGEYLLIETPGNPGFFWGNYLLFSHAPREGDYKKWRALFDKHFSHIPEVRHCSFGWDATEEDWGVFAPFKKAGFKPDPGDVMLASAASLKKPRRFQSGLEVRPLGSDADWEAALANQISTRDHNIKLEHYLPFKKKQMDAYRLMVEAGCGQWFGAFRDGNMEGDLGLFFEPDEKLGRFQSVVTLPNFRRQGVCATLVYEASLFGFHTMKLDTLVMVADSGEPAGRVYRSVGFELKEKQMGCCWWDREYWGG